MATAEQMSLADVKNRLSEVVDRREELAELAAADAPELSKDEALHLITYRRASRIM